MSLLPLLYFLLVLLHPHQASPYPRPRHVSCDPTTQYTPNSSFTYILAEALRTLQFKTAATGFATVSITTTTDNATALALCRGSLNPSECQICIDAAVEGIRFNCPSLTAKQIWYDYCMVRHSTVNFIGEPNTTIAFRFSDPRYGPNPESYVKCVEFLARNLSATAAGSVLKFAVGRTNSLNDQMLYGYFDCTRDLSGRGCEKCFDAAMDEVRLWCITHQICWILTPTCNVQISMFPDHVDWVISPLIWNNETMAASAPAPTADPIRQYDLKNDFLVVGVVAAFILVVGAGRRFYGGG